MKPFLRSLFVLTLLLSYQLTSQAQTTRPYDSIATKIMKTGLATGQAYQMLTGLCAEVGSRLSGSPNAAKAVEWTKAKMQALGFDSVYTQKVMVPHWVRGDVEDAWVVGSSLSTNGSSHENVPLAMCALGGSIGTPEEGITAEVLEVHDFDELQKMKDNAKGKIIFFDRPMDKTKYTTFEAYGGAVNQRGSGSVEAARVGGVAALVRSMTTQLDNVPHTGAMHYNDSLPKVPGVAISTIAANYLSDLLKKDPHVKVYIKCNPQTLPDVESANVIGEIRGTELPNEVIVIGGHLDSWDEGTGAHDDGAGIMQSIEAVRLLKELGLRPKRTIRAVMFINEENGLRGGIAYAAQESSKVKHLVAFESDAGGFAPHGFGVSTDSVRFQNVKKWEYLFEGIDADHIKPGGGGSDISPLGRMGIPMISLRVDSHRYFDYHHSANDTIDKVNERELEMGAAMMAILGYVLAMEGM